MRWTGLTADKGPTFSVTNTSGLTLKTATASLWFYDKTGKRLDVIGAKKYSTPASADAFGSTPLKPSETRDLNISFSANNVPTGAVEIEAEIVRATVVKADGTEGAAWHNDDLNADARTVLAPLTDAGLLASATAASTTTPPSTAIATAPHPTPMATTPGTAAAAASGPGGRPKPAAPKSH